MRIIVHFYYAIRFCNHILFLYTKQRLPVKELIHKLRYCFIIAALALLTASCGGGDTTAQNDSYDDTETSVTAETTETDAGITDIEGTADVPEWAYSYVSRTAPEETDSEREIRVGAELETILGGTTAKSAGTVPVIIRLKDGFVPEGLLDSKQKATQRTRIETAQNKFINTFREGQKPRTQIRQKLKDFRLLQ